MVLYLDKIHSFKYSILVHGNILRKSHIFLMNVVLKNLYNLIEKLCV
jgi:hypothetical protein